MADKAIGELTKATLFDDNSLMIAEQQGAAVSVPGSLLKQFIRDSDVALPTVTTADNDKILRVVDGVWAAVEVPFAEGESV